MTDTLATDGYYGSGLVPSSGTPPTVTIVSPTPGVAPGDAGGFPLVVAVAAVTPIVLQIMDTSGGVRYVCVVARFDGQPVEEVVYRRGLFRGLYVAGSTQQSLDANGSVQLSCVRAGGWLGAVTFEADAIDDSGDVDS